MDAPAELTRILNAAAGGDRAAGERLTPLLYAQLRAMARGHVRHERKGGTLHPTELLHEAWLRLFGPGTERWETRGQFYFAAGEAMRRILVEHARARSRLKRGGDRLRVPLDPEQPDGRPRDGDAQLLDLDAALERLERCDPRKAAVVTLRFFGGLGMAEVAEALGLSKRLVELEWARARAWLLDVLGDPTADIAERRAGS